MKTTALSLRNFSFAYGHSKQANLEIPGLEICGGETVALVGRNGSGKSTLLMSLAGLLKPQKGERLTFISQNKIAFVFQTPCLDKKLTVAENLRLFGKIWGKTRKEIDESITKLNAALGLKEFLERPVQALSGGQQRRADLGRALLIDPDLLFLDEPSVGLDVIAQREFWSVLAEARKVQPNLTLVCASHHATELKLFERIIFLDQGKISLDIHQGQLLKDLPTEILELNTHPAAELFKQDLYAATKLSASVFAHDKLVLFADDAGATLEKIKISSSLQSSIESAVIRKTQLSDAVWQQLLRISSNSMIDATQGAHP